MKLFDVILEFLANDEVLKACIIILAFLITIGVLWTTFF
jgi:hypothetical protein